MGVITKNKLFLTQNGHGSFENGSVSQFRKLLFGHFGLLTILLLVGGVIQGCSRNPATGRRELVLISAQEEIEMGNQAAPELERQFGGKVPDTELQNYVSNVGRKVSHVSDRKMPYQFTLVASDTPNAFALPGGNIFITAGLFEVIENERQLAGVLSHEVAHVSALHNVKGMQRQMGAAILASVAGSLAGADAATAAEIGTKVATNMINLRYSRQDEYEADQIGIRYMQRAGYHPYGMVEMLTVLNNLGGSSSKIGEMFQTHPLTQNRIEQAREEAAQYGKPGEDPNTNRFRTMRRKLAEYKYK